VLVRNSPYMGKKGLFIHKPCSIWAPWAFGLSSDLSPPLYLDKDISVRYWKRKIQLISLYEHFWIILCVASWDGCTKLRHGLPQTGRWRVRTDWTSNSASRDLKMYLRAIRPVLKSSAVLVVALSITLQWLVPCCVVGTSRDETSTSLRRGLSCNVCGVQV
jgi:hypothetical protein